MKPKSDTKVSYNTCDRCKEKVATLYWNRIERRWLCEKCQFRDRTKESIIAPNAQKGV